MKTVVLSEEWSNKNNFKVNNLNNLIFNLLGNENDWFIKECWEKKPCLFKSPSSTTTSPSSPSSSSSTSTRNDNNNNNNNNNSILNLIFSKNILLSLCNKNNNNNNNNYDNNKESKLTYLNNMNVVKYILNQRISHELIEKEVYINKNSVKSFFNDGYTVQFFQPQRFSDELFYICAAFEEYFGTLAGSSAYLTPPNTQGLAPHWDDVEVFILQTQGSKQWNLWYPNGIQLPDTYSRDLQRETLSSMPDEQFILDTGDILYFPRGTIHEAIALDNFSTHITISVYQKYHNKLLIERILPSLLEKYFDKQPQNLSIIPEIRKGLPINVFSKLGSHVSTCLKIQSKLYQSNNLDNNESNNNNNNNNNNNSYELIRNYREDYKRKLKSILNDMVDALDEDDIDEGIDLIGDDFCQNRLPDPITTTTTMLEDDQTNIYQGIVWNDKQLFLQKYKSIDKFIENMITLKKIKKYSDIYFKISPASWFHLRRQIVDGVHLLLIGTGKNNNRLNHMGHQIDDNHNHDHNDNDNGSDENENNQSELELESESESNEEIDPQLEWVKLTLPIRFQKLISLFHILSNNHNLTWISFQEYLINLKKCDKSFIEEEIFELIFGLFNINLLDIAITEDVKDLIKSKRKSSNSNSGLEKKRKKLRQG